MEDYVDSLCREIRVSAEQAQGHALTTASRRLDTVFFGGGTPSLLPPGLLETVLTTLDESFGISDAAEISMEMDPGTFDRAKLLSFAGLGVNRVSLGVQAFQEDALKACGRAHSLRDVNTAIEDIHSVGMRNWSLDLISSLPHQGMTTWRHSIARAIQADPAHISIYDLQIEEGTAFARRYKPGMSPLPSDGLSADMYREAAGTLAGAGFEHYEISNYAKPGYQCRHNMVYWRNASFRAYGLGAASYIDNQRFSRPKTMTAYKRWVDDYAKGGGVIQWPTDTAEDRLYDTVMLALRTRRGLNMLELSQEFGAGAAEHIRNEARHFVHSGLVLPLDSYGNCLRQEHVDLGADTEAGTAQESENGQISAISKEIRFLRLSDPEGFLLSNEVISSLFAALSAINIANPAEVTSSGSCSL
eukprot:SM000087S23392  [mRNA]  locus=s87:409225:411277:+ [translate_table: standard]